MANPNAPHRAVIWLQAELHELLPSGECASSTVLKIPRFVLVLDGQDQAIAERQLNEFVAELKQRCRPTKSS